MARLRIGCVVMAAGNARRFGENKLAVQVQGKALFRRALEAVPAERFVATLLPRSPPRSPSIPRTAWSAWCGTPMSWR